MMKLPRKISKGSPSRRGVSLIEIVIVVVIVSIIITLIGNGLSRALNQQMLNNDVEIVVSAIQRARAFTLASQDKSGGTGRRYGVYFDIVASPNEFSIFYGNDKSQQFEPPQKLSESSFSSSQTVAFERITGDAQTISSGVCCSDITSAISITLTSRRSPTLMRTITVSPVGIVEI